MSATLPPEQDIELMLISEVEAYGILYEDVSDDGDGDLKLTELGRKVVRFIEKLILKQ